MILTIIVICLFLIVVVVRWTSRKRKSNAPHPPGPSGVPLLGTLIGTSFEQFHAQIWKWANMYGDIFTFSLLGKKFVILNNHQLIKKALAGENYRDVLQERPRTFMSDVVLPNDIAFNSKMTEQQAMKKILHKALYGDCVQKFETNAGGELDFLCRRIDNEAGENLQMDIFIKESLSNLISIIMSGKRFDDGDDDANMFWDLDDSVENLIQPSRMVILTALPILRHIPGLFGNVCRHNQEAKNKIVKKFFLEIKRTYVFGEVRGLVDVIFGIQEDLRSQGVTWFTDDHTQSLVIDIVGAALSTSFATLASYFLTLIHHPEVQKRIHDEIDDVIGHSRKPTKDDHSHMPYVQATILENFRYLTPVPTSLPHLASEDIVLDGFLIEKDTVVLPYLWSIHHDSKIYDNPWIFWPDRFLDVEGNVVSSEDPKRQSLMPFGVGRRMCPGESLAKYWIFMYITTLLQRFQFLPPEGVDLPSSDPRTYQHRLANKPPDFMCRVTRRQ